MGKCKTKSIQTDLGTFRHNQAYPGIVQTYSDIFRTLTYLEPCYIQNPDIIRIRIIFRILAYLQPWCIPSPDIFRTLAYSKFEAYSQPCQTTTMKCFDMPIDIFK